MSIIAEKQQAIKELLGAKINSGQELMAIKRKLAKKYNMPILLNSDILQAGTNINSPLQRILRKRAVRTLSGIAPVAVLTKPFPCPGECAYCPRESNVPPSYLSNEPAVMRAIRCGYDPYKQVQLRLRALEANGHEPAKIELIVIGGTWSVLPVGYKYWYIMQCFKAANEYRKKFSIFNFQFSIFQFNKLRKRLLYEQKKNEKAKYRLIGITLETRPDYINEQELWQMRELGCTRVELGAQAIDDKILTLNKRGHGVAAIVIATKLLKNFGFKVTYHIMPGLPGATAKKDLAMFKQLFTDERFQPDQLKFYPTVVTRGSLLYRWWRAGKYKPYTNKVLQNLIINCKKIVPPYVRIIRLIRDIPGESIMAGNIVTNLRQVLQDKGVICGCIRCREARELRVTSCELRVIKYKASGGDEYFISFESKDGKVLYGFCRLRLMSRNVERITHNVKSCLSQSCRGEVSSPRRKNHQLLSADYQGGETPPLLANFFSAALIRELHVYGQLVPVGQERIIQHAGLGKKLMQQAEKIARQNGYDRMAVIAGVGARGYYRKLGYKLSHSYMVKSLL